MNEFVRYDNWFNNLYSSKLDSGDFFEKRYITYQLGLNLFQQRKGSLIVETGCQREKDDWTAGCSTQIFCSYLEKYGGHLYSIDNDIKHILKCHQIVNSSYLTLIHNDSVTELEKFEKSIDLLYLDSYDYPIDLLAQRYGNTNIEESIRDLSKEREEVIIEKFGDILQECQAHCLKEIKTAEHCLHSKSIVIIDDCCLPGGGKGRLAKNYLEETGWICLLDKCQSVWIREYD